MSYKVEGDVDYSDGSIILGKGSFGDVCLIYDHVKKVFIAVKKLYQPQDVMNKTGMKPAVWETYVKREIDCLLKFSHLVPFAPLLAHSAPPKNDNQYGYYLYLDFICGGGLNEIIQQLRFAKSQEWDEEEDIESNVLVGWDLKQELIVAYGTARALQFIHETNRVHRDIKPDNILLTHDLEPKICDFGGGRRIGRNGNITIAVGTWYYNAPEKGFNLEGGEKIASLAKMTNESGNEVGSYGAPSDMYSWAVTMYEMTTLKRPFEDYIKPGDERSEQRCKGQIISNSLRPKFPEDYDHPLKEIIEVCWDKSPEIRYTAEVACQKIYEIAHSVLEREDWRAFKAYAKKVENPRDMNDYEGFHQNVKASINRNIAKAYYTGYCLYNNGICHKKNTEKAEQLYDQYQYLLSDP